MITVNSFAKLGFRTLPIGIMGCVLERDKETLKKHIYRDGNLVLFKDAMPGSWTVKYGQNRKKHKDSSLGGLICGPLENKEESELEVIALDCDNQASWDMLRALDPSYSYCYESIDKPGGTILYLLPEELRDIRQYSIKDARLHFEFMSKRDSGPNAMVYLPTTSNKTKQLIPEEASITLPPSVVVDIILALRPSELTVTPVIHAESKSVLPFNAPLVKQYVLESKAAAVKGGFGKLKDSSCTIKIYKTFTPKKFRAIEVYMKQGWVHPNSEALLERGSYSEYIIGVSAIAGADPSIDASLYVEFMQAINAQLDDPYTTERYLHEVINPMLNGKSKVKGSVIWKYNESWDQDSHTLANQYGDTLEYFINEVSANEFVEYNHVTKQVVPIRGVNSLLDRIYTMDTDPAQTKPAKSIVKKLKLIKEENSVKLAPGVHTDSTGRATLNLAEACIALRILQDHEIFEMEVRENNKYVKALNVFLTHLFGDDEESILFFKQLVAYHGKYLTAVPVIIYMVGIGGAGKSQFSNILEALFGSNTTRRPSPQQLTSRFNDFLENCAILVLSETADASYRDQEGIKQVIKTVTGEKSMDIETKGKPLKPNVPMFALPVLLANSLWYNEDTADRRLFAVQPSDSLATSEPIKAFERQHKVRVIDFIIEGIQKGYIPKYLAGFCPELLPEVPLTATKKNFAGSQSNPVAVVKSLVQNEEHEKLFELFEEHEISSFFTSMERPTTRDFYHKQHLQDLAISLKEGEMYPTDREIAKLFIPNSWLEMKSKLKLNTNPNGQTGYKALGRYKWQMDSLSEDYEDWKLNNLRGG